MDNVFSHLARISISRLGSLAQGLGGLARSLLLGRVVEREESSFVFRKEWLQGAFRPIYSSKVWKYERFRRASRKFQKVPQFKYKCSNSK
jgi:hypothetical protein